MKFCHCTAQCKNCGRCCQVCRGQCYQRTVIIVKRFWNDTKVRI